MNRDGLIDYVALSDDGSVVTIFTRQKNGLWKEWSLSTKFEADDCLIADLDNDRRNDIVLFGKKSTGVAVLIAGRKGTWQHGPTLFPDISVSDLRAADLNADGVLDILLLDWLSNQLSVFNGISRFVYSEQVTVQLPAEPSQLALTPISEPGTFLVAITFPREKAVGVFTANALGDYRSIGTLTFDALPMGVQFADVNNDKEPDILSATRLGIHVAFSTPAAFTTPIVFGCAKDSFAWQPSDIDADGKTDCVIVENETGMLRLLLNGESENKSILGFTDGGRRSVYCVGASPSGLLVGDLNGDGRNDLLVANSASSSLSVLLNQGRGRFAGQISLSTVARPQQGRFVRSSSGDRTIVCSHPMDNAVTVVQCRKGLDAVETFVVPTGDEPYVMDASEDSARVKFLVRYRDARDRSMHFSLFEQIAEGKFVEQSFRKSSTPPIIALTVGTGASLGTYDFVFATHSRETMQTTIWHSTCDPGMKLSSPTRLFAYADSAASATMVFFEYVDGDARKDVVVVLGAPTKALGIWYAQQPDESKDSIEWIRNVQPLDEEAIIVKDVNGDERTDIVWIDGLRKSVLALYGTQRKGFGRPVEIAAAEDARSLRVASLTEIGVNDLILSHTERGSVSIRKSVFQR